jgi:Fe-S-cluster containining protein
MGVDCLKCINSGCCKLKITINKKEYDSLIPKIKKQFVKHLDVFLEKNPRYKIKKKFLESMYNNNYAEMKKGIDGYCNFLDKKTMLCSVYENRPKICKDYTNDKCVKIRLLK